MLDKYVFGKVTRISPEAPVPIILENSRKNRIGGAGNVSANISSLNAENITLGVYGFDSEALEIEKLFLENTSNSLIRTKRSTTTKTRFMAHNQQLLRLDKEDSSALDSEVNEQLLNQYNKLLSETDLILISDYGKGVINKETVTKIIQEANKQHIPVIVDPKKPNYEFYKGAWLITPNTKEAAEMLKQKIEDLDFESAGFDIARKYSVKNVIITRGSEGMSIYEHNQDAKHIKPTAKQVYDVTGAGDTVIATLAVTLQKGLGVYESAQIANYAAGIVVEKIGTTPINIKELSNKLKEKNIKLYDQFV